MRLVSFRVTDFRSVEDSGWIDVSDVSALIGTNESGKTNLLVPLWKLNPAKDGDIDLLADAPRKRYNEFRASTPKPVFIHAMFDLPEDLAATVAGLCDMPSTELSRVIVTRRFDGERGIQFPNAPAETQEAITQIADVRAAIFDRLPKFVYYAHYGNLDSEIYLPHVMDNLRRADLGSRESAKVRTLRVLFDFVKLSPQEIHELGRDGHANGKQSAAAIADISKRKKERDVLLQSASTDLTKLFREWWRQGTYRFRFQADGDYFRIWVSDDKRPEDIELEGRSSGLQWFLSFYLIFLVESSGAHHDAILLLDEPGLSLHPIAQRDLSAFFENLARTNQLIYTTHSPFLVEPNRLDRVKAVYVKQDGATGVSADLRAADKDQSQSQSIYPVHAALGLSLSDILFTGSRPIIVEDASDQQYLSAIKTILISAGRIRPPHELIFVPAGGIRGVKAVASILAGKDETLPVVLLDGDERGRLLAAELRSGTYAAAQDRVLNAGAYCAFSDAEVEDLMPFGMMVSAASRLLLRGPDDEFQDVAREGTPVVCQIEDYARKHGITLATPRWKIELAGAVRARILKQGRTGIQDAVLSRWTTMFETLIGRPSSVTPT
jgi:energy-coupling factor transporter ATP-binding protein EcfA2